jgi:hypothetical protein
MDTDVFITAEVAETVEDPAAVIVLDQDKVARLLKANKDEEPQFPIIRVEEGLSRNNFLWTGDVLDNVAEQINKEEPVAYMGHIKPEDDRWAFPEPQTVWLKAVTKIENGKKALYVKGYNFGDTIRRLTNVKAARSTSWQGKADCKLQKGGVRQVVNFKLESLDWSRPGKSAMEARLVTVAAEQTGGDDKVEPSEIGALTKSDLEKHNPNLVLLLKQEAVKDGETAVAEMEEKVKKGEEAESLLDRIRKAIGLSPDDDILKSVTEAFNKVEEIGRTEVKNVVAKLLEKKVPDAKQRAVVMRLLPVAEMEDKTEQEIEAQVNEAFEKDDDIKAYIAENTGPAPLRRRSAEDRQQRAGTRSGRLAESVTKL